MFADFQKENGFLGREAALEKKGASPFHRRLVQVLVEDPDPLLFAGEPLRRNGSAVGYVRAGSYGFTLGGAVGLGMVEAGEPVTRSYLNEGTWEVEIAGRVYPARVSLRPFYDPKMERVRI